LKTEPTAEFEDRAAFCVELKFKSLYYNFKYLTKKELLTEKERDRELEKEGESGGLLRKRE
jgi:hypothetical protein